MKRLIDVYVYRFRHEKPEFLLFLRSSKKIYANQWRMIGGKVEEGEPYWKAALREFNEETGLSPDNFWVIPSVNTFYEAQSDQIHQIPELFPMFSNLPPCVFTRRGAGGFVLPHTISEAFLQSKSAWTWVSKKPPSWA